MKIRQKIAMLLASAMVLTAVPAVTMAKSDFALKQGILINKKDEKVTADLKVTMKDATDATFMFFVNLENAEFASTETDKPIAFDVLDSKTGTSPSVEYTQVNEKKEMKVVVKPGGTDFKAEFSLPLYVKLKGGDATVAVDGAGSYVSDMAPVVFAKTNEKEATVKVEDAKKIFAESSKVAKIIVEESIAGTLYNDGTINDIEFTVRHSDYEIKGITVVGEKGFDNAIGGTFDKAGNGNDAGYWKYTPNSTNVNKNVAGRLVFELELDATTKKPSTGALEIKVAGKNIADATVKVADVVDYGTIVEMKDSKVVDINEGKKADITFKVKETVADTFNTRREFDVTFDGAFLSSIKKITDADMKAILQGKVVCDSKDLEVTDIIKTDDFVTGFTVRTAKADNTEVLDNTKIDEIEFKDIPVFVPLGKEGDIKVKVAGRALGYDGEAVAVNAKKIVEVTTEAFTAKVGQKEQTGGKIVIKELDKAVLGQGEYVLIKLENEDGMKFDGKGTVEVTDGDMVIDDIDVKDGVLYIKVKRESTVASTITIKDIKLKLDRTVPQGMYKIEVAGRAMAPDWTQKSKGDKEFSFEKPLEVKDFVNVATANTEDLSTNNGLRKGTASFVIDSDKFIVNGVEKTMDAKAYLDPAGRTMVPVRYVANALGIDDTNIFYAQKTASIVAGGKTISVTLGDKVAKINNVAAKVMDVAPTMANDRVYVPVGEIASLLSVDATWDGATQTATFTVK